MVRSREAGRRAMHKLSSPLALIGAAGRGEEADAAVAKRRQRPPHPERRKSDRRQSPPFTWTTADFVIVEDLSQPQPRPARSRTRRK